MSVAARAADIHGGPKIFNDVCRSYQSDMWPQHTWRKQRSSVELVKGTPLQRATDLQRILLCATLLQYQYKCIMLLAKSHHIDMGTACKPYCVSTGDNHSPHHQCSCSDLWVTTTLRYAAIRRCHHQCSGTATSGLPLAASIGMHLQWDSPQRSGRRWRRLGCPRCRRLLLRRRWRIPMHQNLLQHLAQLQAEHKAILNKF